MILIRMFSTICEGDLLLSLNNLLTPKSCIQIINTADGNSTFEFDQPLTASEVTLFDDYLTNWVCPILPPTLSNSELDDNDIGEDVIWSSSQVLDSIKSNSDYTPVVSNTTLGTEKKYLLTQNGSYWLPNAATVGIGYSIQCIRATGTEPNLSTGFGETIITSIGSDNVLVIDEDENVALVSDGVNWVLEI